MIASENYKRLLAGLCTDCDNALEHGPFTHEQIDDACKGMGISIEEFSDVCDDCFVKHIAGGDARYAAHLLGRPVKLQSPGAVFSALLGVSHG